MGTIGATNSSAIIAGSEDSPKALVEEWDNTSWTEVADLSTARDNRGSGTVANGIVYGGAPQRNATEEWTGATQNIKVLTD